MPEPCEIAPYRNFETGPSVGFVSRLTIRNGPRGALIWMGPLEDPPPIGLHGPQHTTLPRALEPLERLGLDAKLWADMGPLLDGILTGHREAGPVGEMSTTLVGGVAHAARAAGVRPYSESLRAALDYALTCADASPPTDVELWSIKDGRRSSVWRARMGDRVMALNVARDDIAAAELVAMGHELRDLHAIDPLGVVDVLDITPDVLVCSWIDGRELHAVDRGDGRGLFIAVEESVAAANGRQLMLTGREGVPASDALWGSWLEALVRQTTVDEQGKLSRPRVETCEGDLMLLNEQPVLVALSPGPVVRDRAGWERDLIDLRSGDRPPALRWGDRAAARAAFRRALTMHGDPAVMGSRSR
jgi:hypothetical protein